MKHIYPAHAYSMGPIRECYWAEDVPSESLARPPTQGSLRTRTVIIGAGFTGLNAALRLAEAGEDVVVLEAEFPGFGASGRNGGFCCLGGARISDAGLLSLYGQTGPQAVRRAEVGAIAHVEDLLTRHGWDVDRHSQGETIMAHTAAKMDSLRSWAAECEAEYGAPAQVIEKDALRAHGMNGTFQGAVSHPMGFALHPRKYLAGLLGAAEAAGAVVHGASPVLETRQVADGWVLKTPQAEVTADCLIVATNGYSSEDLPRWMRGRYLPAQSSVIATRVMTEEELERQGWTTRQMCYEDRRLLHYFHLTPEGRMVFGQRGGIRSHPLIEKSLQRKVRADFDRLFPDWRGVETPYYWSGMVCITGSLMPFCGAIPGARNAYAAFGYHGNGVAMGSLCGAAVADLARAGETDLPLPAFFGDTPRRMPPGRLRRLALLADYSWATLTRG
ncbi:NAD(P)/FAD-dependent oxidoreductase [Maritimibacter alkaliphilus]|uniref:NAD(P)/FAD-dependent oxidoreductase n=1 Tax=Maritimibacter alkaliphilus TaxID=404236 RepID=UPI001C97B97D|nr:FAD-binding oxidoreductase [Maritimibacter alkaliphilus]MBY6090352.1 FAD-binding oxidoreductase [Maritimibacter alkaliphilus]